MEMKCNDVPWSHGPNMFLLATMGQRGQLPHASFWGLCEQYNVAVLPHQPHRDACRHIQRFILRAEARLAGRVMVQPHTLAGIDDLKAMAVACCTSIR